MSRFIRWAVLFAALAAPGPALATLRVAASTTDLASIANSIAGGRAEVFAIARPTSDPHRIEALPSYMVKVSRAQVFLEIGLGLDQWADAIVDGSRNERIAKVDCSAGVPVLEKPEGKVDASMGDVHPNGNPHYWLDPRNGAVVAHNIAEAFARADPANAAAYRAGADAFAKDCADAYEKDKALAASLPSKAVFTYHRSWSYLANAFGLEVVSTVEPVPGIPPTAKHLAELVETAQARHVALLIQEPYFAADAGRFLARSAGVRVVTASSSCADERAGSYLAHVRDVLAECAGGTAK